MQTESGSRYLAYSSLHELFEATRYGEIDAVVTDSTINNAHAEHLQFTQPWSNAGLLDSGLADFTALFQN